MEARALGTTPSQGGQYVYSENNMLMLYEWMLVNGDIMGANGCSHAPFDAGM